VLYYILESVVSIAREEEDGVFGRETGTPFFFVAAKFLIFPWQKNFWTCIWCREMADTTGFSLCKKDLENLQTRIWCSLLPVRGFLHPLLHLLLLRLVCEQERKNEAMQEEAVRFGFGVRRACSVEMLLVYN
jgi:hypothetical protein